MYNWYSCNLLSDSYTFSLQNLINNINNWIMNDPGILYTRQHYSDNNINNYNDQVKLNTIL